MEEHFRRRVGKQMVNYAMSHEGSSGTEWEITFESKFKCPQCGKIEFRQEIEIESVN